MDISKPKNTILLVIPWKFDRYGGVDVVVEQLQELLTQALPKTKTVIAQENWNSTSPSVFDNEKEIFNYALPPFPKKRDLPHNLKYLISVTIRAIRLLHLLRSHKVSHVAIHFPSERFWPLFALKKLRLWRGKIILSFHGTDVQNLTANSHFCKFILKHSDANTACSKHLADQLLKKAPYIIPTKIHVTYNSINYSDFLVAKDNSTYRTPPKDKYFLSIGSFVKNKGHDITLKAFAESQAPQKGFSIVLIGGAGEPKWLNQLNSICKQYQIESKVIVLTNQPKACVATYLANAYGLIHTPHSEAFGIVLLEAATFATPVIATRTGGIPEIIRTPELGYLVAPNSIEETSAAINFALANPTDFKKRGEAFSRFTQREFTGRNQLVSYLRALG